MRVYGRSVIRSSAPMDSRDRLAASDSGQAIALALVPRSCPLDRSDCRIAFRILNRTGGGLSSRTTSLRDPQADHQRELARSPRRRPLAARAPARSPEAVRGDRQADAPARVHPHDSCHHCLPPVASPGLARFGQLAGCQGRATSCSDPHRRWPVRAGRVLVTEMAPISPHAAAALSAQKRGALTLALSVEQACEALGVSWDTWRAHIEPDVRLVRLGRRKLIPVSELQAWLDRHAESVGVGK